MYYTFPAITKFAILYFSDDLKTCDLTKATPPMPKWIDNVMNQGVGEQQVTVSDPNQLFLEVSSNPKFIDFVLRQQDNEPRTFEGIVKQLDPKHFSYNSISEMS